MPMLASNPDEQLVQQMDEAVQQLNAFHGRPHPLQQFRPEREQYEFETITEKGIAAMIALAQNAVTEAQNNLEAAKQLAEEIRAKIKKEADRNFDSTERAKLLATRLLEAGKEYHGVEKDIEPKS